MAQHNTKKVTVGKPKVTGAMNSAPIGTALPVDATSAINSAFVNLGYVSEDGLTNTVETDTEDIVAWGGDTLMTVRTSRSETFSWTFIQSLDGDVLKEVYGQDNVTVAGDNITVLHNAKELPHRSYVIEMLMTSNAVKRIVIPDSVITEVGDISYQDGEVVGYEVTLSAFPDDAGNTAYEYITLAAAPAVGP